MMLKINVSTWYISVVRDPISRAVSHYNYIRIYSGYNREWLNTTKDKKRSINTCVQENYPECSSRYFTHELMFYFCGYDPSCAYNTRDTLNRAKANYKHFSVVGILEEYEDFWLLLQHTLPQYFSGAVQSFRSRKKIGKEQINKGKYNSLPTNVTLELMKERLALDIEFYEWIKKNVHEKVAKLKSLINSFTT